MHMRKKRYLLLICSCIILALFTPKIIERVSSSDFGVREFFEGKEEKVNAFDASLVLAEGKTFVITAREFVDYKENVKLISQLNNEKFNLPNEELLARMLETRLLIQFADEQGIQVSSKEVYDYAMQTKEGYQQNDSPQLEEIQKALARKYNVSTDDYFTHPDVLKQYENIVKVDKLMNQMALEGKITDDYTVDTFVADINKQYTSAVHINYELLNKIE